MSGWGQAPLLDRRYTSDGGTIPSPHLPEFGVGSVDADTAAGSQAGTRPQDEHIDQLDCHTARCRRTLGLEPPMPKHFQYHVSPLERDVFRYVFSSSFEGGITASATFALLRSGSSVFVNAVSIYINMLTLPSRNSYSNYNLSQWIVAYVEFIMFHILLLWGLYRIHSVARRGPFKRASLDAADIATAADQMRTQVQRLAWQLIISLGTFQTFQLLDYFRPPRVRSLLMRARTQSAGAVLQRIVTKLVVPMYVLVGCLSVMAVFVKLSQLEFIFDVDKHPLCLEGHACWEFLWYVKFAGFFNNLIRLDYSENRLMELLQFVAVGHFSPAAGVQGDKADGLVTSFYEQMFRSVHGERVHAFQRFTFFAALNSASLLRYLEMCEGVGTSALKARGELDLLLQEARGRRGDGAMSDGGEESMVADQSVVLVTPPTTGERTASDRKREILRSMDPVCANPIVGVDSATMPRFLRIIDESADKFLRRGYLRPVTLDHGPSPAVPGVFKKERGRHRDHSVREGGICLTVERAYELLETDWSVGKLTGAGADPYVIIATQRHQRLRTSTRRNTLFPDFNESFILPLPEKRQGLSLDVSVFDEGSSVGGFMGVSTLVVPFDALFLGKRRYRLKLKGRPGNTGDAKRQARNATPGKAAGFGFVDVLLYARKTEDVAEIGDDKLRSVYHLMPVSLAEGLPHHAADLRWKPDKHAPTCEGCHRKFTLTLRRHHCRRCGGVFCNSCSRNRAKLEFFGEEKQRVCDSCSEEIVTGKSEVRAMRKELTIAELRSTFDQVDCDHSNEIDKEELEIMRPLLKGMGVSDEAVNMIIEEADEDGNDKVNFDEFVAIFRDRLNYAIIAGGGEQPERASASGTDASPLVPRSASSATDPDAASQYSAGGSPAVLALPGGTRGPARAGGVQHGAAQPPAVTLDGGRNGGVLPPVAVALEGGKRRVTVHARPPEAGDGESAVEMHTVRQDTARYSPVAATAASSRPPGVFAAPLQRSAVSCNSARAMAAAADPKPRQRSYGPLLDGGSDLGSPVSSRQGSADAHRAVEEPRQRWWEGSPWASPAAMPPQPLESEPHVNDRRNPSTAPESENQLFFL